MKRLGYRPPSDVAEPDQLVLVEYVSDGRVAIIALNRPHADNAITTELAAQLIEVLETIAARSSVRVAIITGAGDRAFSVGRRPVSAQADDEGAMAAPAPGLRSRSLHAAPAAQADHRRSPWDGLRRWLRDRHQHGLHHRVRRRRLRPARSDGRFVRRWRRAGLSSPCSSARQGHADAHDRRTHNCTRGLPAWHGQRSPSQSRADGRECSASPRRSQTTRRRRCSRSNVPLRWDRERL